MGGEKRHAPEAREGQHHRTGGTGNEKQQHHVAIAQNLLQVIVQAGLLRRAMRALEVAGVTALGGVIAHHEPSRTGNKKRQRRAHPHDAPPAEFIHQQSQWRAGEHRTQHANRNRNTRGECVMPGRHPVRRQFQHANECDADRGTNQQPAETRGTGILRHRKQGRAERGEDGTGGQ